MQQSSLEAVTIESLKNYNFVYESLDAKFANLPEEEKMAFCRTIKESWNSPIREVFEHILKQFYEELALRSKTMEEINAERSAIVVFLAFKKYLEGKISLFEQKIQNSQRSLETIKSI